MRKLSLIFMLLFCALSVASEDLKPLADFGVHAVVTSGPTVYEERRSEQYLPMASWGHQPFY